MNKRQEMAEQTKKNLQEAFWELYQQKPIEKITVKEVTDFAGYNRGTFYLYYKDIYDILATIEQDLLATIGEFADRWMAESIVSEWHHYVAQLIEWSQVYAPYASVLLSDRGDPAFTHQLKNILRPVVSRWLVTPEDLSGAEREILTEFQLSGTMSAISTWLSQEDPMSFADFVTFMMNHFFPENK